MGMLSQQFILVALPPSFPHAHNFLKAHNNAIKGHWYIVLSHGFNCSLPRWVKLWSCNRLLMELNRNHQGLFWFLLTVFKMWPGFLYHPALKLLDLILLIRIQLSQYLNEEDKMLQEVVASVHSWHTLSSGSITKYCQDEFGWAIFQMNQKVEVLSTWGH